MDEESLFDAALERSTTLVRRGFLEQACGNDVGLRRRMERLLSAHLKTLGVLDRSARPPDWVPSQEEDDSTFVLAGEHAGTLVAGRYRLLEEVGDGGMGSVWKAEQTEPVQRIVAVKLIKEGMDSASVLARFEAERQALAMMDHPNIAKVLDGGTTDEGRPFFVMEYVEGVSLTRYCDEARLSIADRLALFVAVCEAVQHAHIKGVIHRDLKPGNILVCVRDGRPVPKVIDFGLAKAMERPLTGHNLVTAHGALLGTPLYMSPEQAELSNLDIDARTDVYALGVILYELLTGTTPLERERFHEAPWHELLWLIKEEEPPRPSVRLSDSDELPSLAAQRRLEAVKLTRLVRGELDWIVMKCLEKDRSRRYETPNALARDVQRYLADESVEACPPSTGYRFGKFIRRHRGPVLAASIFILLLVGGIAGTTWGLMRADRCREAEKDRAEGEAVAKIAAERRLKQVEKGSEILASIFTDLDPKAEEKEGRPLRAILGDRLDRAAAELAGDAIGEPLAVANLQDRLGRTYRALGHADKAKPLFARALATRRERLGAEHPDTLATMSQLASALKDAGDLNEAIALFEQVRDGQLRTLGADQQATLTTTNNLAMAYWLAGRASEACALLEKAREIVLKTFGPEHPETIDVLDNLSAVYVSVGKGHESIALAQQVRDARVKAYGVDHPAAIASLSNLAIRYQAAGKMSQALALYEEARDGMVPRLGPSHPNTLMILDSLARMYRAFGRTAEALPLAEHVRDMRMLTLGAYNPYTIHSLDTLGVAYQSAGSPEKALAAFRQAAVGLEKLDFAHATAGRIIANLCDCLEQQGKADESDAWRRKWLAAARRKHGPESLGYAEELAEQGEDLLSRNRHSDAEKMLRDSLAILEKTQPESWETCQGRSLLGEALLEQGRFAEAEPVLLRGYEGLKAREGQIPPLYVRCRMTEAAGRVTRLYEAWGQSSKADEWRARQGSPDSHG